MLGYGAAVSWTEATTARLHAACRVAQERGLSIEPGSFGVIPDTQERSFLQRVCGYVMTSHNTEQVFFILLGPSGANGKSTFTTVIQRILGDYAQTAPAHTFIETPRGQTVGDDLADLAGIRGVFLPELKTGAAMNADLVKRFSGGDHLRVRHLYARYFTIRPTAKILITSNAKPNMGTDGDALWRRLMLIPFRETIPPEERIEGLADILIDEEGPWHSELVPCGHRHMAPRAPQPTPEHHRLQGGIPSRGRARADRRA